MTSATSARILQGLLAAAVLAAPRPVAACLSIQALETKLPSGFAEALAQASSVEVSRLWWGTAANPPAASPRLTATLKGNAKMALVAALKTSPPDPDTPGILKIVRRGFPTQPYRISLIHNGQIHTLTICYECGEPRAAPATFGKHRIAIQKSSKDALDVLLKNHGAASPAPSSAERAEMRAVQKAAAEADRIANDPDIIVPRSAGTSPPSAAAGPPGVETAVPGCGGANPGW